MAYEPVPNPLFDTATNAAIIKAGRDPSSMSAVFEKKLEAGGDPSAAVAAAVAEEEMTCFGRTKLNEPAFARDRSGKPIEQGIGSLGNEGSNHWSSIRKYEGEEAYQKAIAEHNIRKKSAKG